MVKYIRFTNEYLRDRKQRTKMSDIYNSWEGILYGVLKGSILGLLLFYIDLCDSLVIMNQNDIASYADDNIPHVYGEKCWDWLLNV